MSEKRKPTRYEQLHADVRNIQSLVEQLAQEPTAEEPPRASIHILFNTPTRPNGNLVPIRVTAAPDGWQAFAEETGKALMLIDSRQLNLVKEWYGTDSIPTHAVDYREFRIPGLRIDL